MVQQGRVQVCSRASTWHQTDCRTDFYFWEFTTSAQGAKAQGARLEASGARSQGSMSRRTIEMTQERKILTTRPRDATHGQSLRHTHLRKKENRRQKRSEEDQCLSPRVAPPPLHELTSSHATELTELPSETNGSRGSSCSICPYSLRNFHNANHEEIN